MTEPVYLSFAAQIIEGSKDVQAIHMIEQVLKHLDLNPERQHAVLEFMADRAELPF